MNTALHARYIEKYQAVAKLLLIPIYGKIIKPYRIKIISNHHTSKYIIPNHLKILKSN